MSEFLLPFMTRDFMTVYCDTRVILFQVSVNFVFQRV